MASRASASTARANGVTMAAMPDSAQGAAAPASGAGAGASAAAGSAEPGAPTVPPLRISDWGQAGVAQWLRSLDFAHLAPAFHDHGIDGDSLVLLDDESLQEVGVASVGQRLSLLAEIYRLKETHDIPIEEGDYIPHSAHQNSQFVATTPEANGSLPTLHAALQIRDERIAVLEAELSKVTLYLQRMHHDFLQLCQIVGLHNHATRTPMPVFAPGGMPLESDTLVLHNHTEGKAAPPMGLSASQPGQASSFHGLPPTPGSANLLSAPAHSRAPNSAPSTSHGVADATNSTLHQQDSTVAAASPLSNPLDSSSAASNPVASASRALTGFGGADAENTYRNFRVTLNDPCYRVLPAALKKYKINDDWRKYALMICHGEHERCVTYEEKPLLLFQKLMESKQNPVFILRHIRDVKNPIALAKAKAEARKADIAERRGSQTASNGQSSGQQPLTARTGGDESASNGGKQPSSAPATTTTTASGSSAGQEKSKKGTEKAPEQTFGTPEWTLAQINKALEKGHDPNLPVLTGAATRVSASSSGAAAAASLAEPAQTAQKSDKDAGTASSAAPDAGTAASASTTTTTTSPARKYAIAIYPYMSEREDEYDVELGDTYIVVSKFKGWWAVERDPRADGQGDPRVVEVALPMLREKDANGEVTTTPHPQGTGSVWRIKTLQTGWVPAGCLLEMSQPLAVAAPGLKDLIQAGLSGESSMASSAGESSTIKADDSPSETGDGKKSPSPQPPPSSSAPHMATYPIAPSLITSPSTPGVMLMDYTSPPEDRLVLRKNDRMRVFKRYSHWSYCVQEGGTHCRGWVPSWYIGRAYTPSSSASAAQASSSSSRRPAAGSTPTGRGSASNRTTQSSGYTATTGSDARPSHTSAGAPDAHSGGGTHLAADAAPPTPLTAQAGGPHEAIRPAEHRRVPSPDTSRAKKPPDRAPSQGVTGVNPDQTAAGRERAGSAAAAAANSSGPLAAGVPGLAGVETAPSTSAAEAATLATTAGA